jgi:transcriptional regulator with XRE-family HTH domain
MRISPLRHPLAILRTTIGLTQKELAVLVDRAARTIQAIELGQLPLSEELALRIAKETGVNESWLLSGDTSVPPQRGAALLAFSPERRPYGREDYEWQRAYNESPIGSEEELAEVVRRGPEKKGGDLTLSPPQAKAVIWAAQPVMLGSMDEKLLGAMASFFKKTLRSEDALLVRWKLRRLLEHLAKERSIELPMIDLGKPEPKRQKVRRIRTNIRVKI